MAILNIVDTNSLPWGVDKLSNTVNVRSLVFLSLHVYFFLNPKDCVFRFAPKCAIGNFIVDHFESLYTHK